MNKFILFAAFVMSSCAPRLGTVVPYDNNVYELHTEGVSEQQALDRALIMAEDSCEGRKFIVKEKDLTYHGVLSEQTTKIVDVARDVAKSAAVLSGNNPTATMAIPRGTRTESDYKVKLLIQCR